MRVDSLTHITRDGSWFATDHDASLASLVAKMKRDGISQSVLAGIPGERDDDIILGAAKKYPGMFIPVAGVDISLPEKSLRERLLQVKESNFAGIKIHPRLSNVSLNNPIVLETVRQAGELSLTTMICTIHRYPLQPLGRNLADAIYELCLKAEKYRIILVHGGYTELLTTSELIRPFENVLLDLSFTVQRFAGSSLGLDVAYLIDNFDRRICIGSDFPEYDMATTMEILKKLPCERSPEECLLLCSENITSYFEDSWLSRTGSERDKQDTAQ